MPTPPGQSTEPVHPSPFAETMVATPVQSSSGPVRARVSSPIVDGGRYEGLDRLGEGGMGEVRLCRDTRTGRDVAMKVMRAEHEGRDDLDARFLREARVQGRMEHPSIVPLYELGVSEGRPYFTMKRVRGATLSDILARLRFRDSEAEQLYSQRKLLAAFAAVCLTMDFAHAHGVVHRDVKPDNIMLGAYGELYVLDWGIARLHSGETVWSAGTDPGSSQTIAGSVFGTLGYMAPEQVDPTIGETDARSDVYALGAVLFEILTLEPLHPGGAMDKMVASTLAPQVRLPSSRAPSRHVPPELDAICAKATAKDPRDRFSSARELHDAIERFREKDRDLETREAGAQEHASRAIAAAEEAREEVDPAAPMRKLCLGEASRALAFDPTHLGALSALRELLAHPPRVLPPEVEREQILAAQRVVPPHGRIAALLLLTWFAYLPLILAVGLRSVRLYAFVSLLFTTAAVALFRFARRPPPNAELPWVARILVAAALSSLCVIWGPLILVPPLAVLVAVVSIVVPRRRTWPVADVAVASAIVLVPVLLELTGLVPPFFEFDGRTLRILPQMVELPERTTLVVAAVTHVLIVLAGAAILTPLRRAFDDAQRRLRLQAWQLGKIVVPEPAAVTPSSEQPEPAPKGQDAPPVATTADTGTGRIGLHERIPTEQAWSERYERRGAVSTEPDGPVLLCEDRRIGRQVAVLVAEGQQGEALLEQGRLQARLEHPSIPPVYDVGEDDQGRVYVTTRRLRGDTLEIALQSAERSSQHKLLEIFGAACLAIDYAHAIGVVHAALSPRCVVVGDYGDVYVTGWRSARSTQELDEAARSSLRRQDIAGLGAILAAILRDPAAAAGEAYGVDRPSLLMARPYVPLELEAICVRARLVAAGEGYETAGALHDAVERFIEGERDVVRRRAQAAVHARVAELEAERALAHADEGGRAAAMREVSQALALDPSNARATGVLMRLITAPPRDIPPEAEGEMRASAREELRVAGRTAAVLYAAAFVVLPFTFLRGITSPILSVLVGASIAAAAVAFWRSSSAKGSSTEPLSTVVCGMLAACAAGAVAGPLVLAPTIVVGNMSGVLLQQGSRRRAAVLVLGCLAFCAPLALQLTHVIPPSYESRDGGIVILPNLAPFAAFTPLLLAAVQVGFVLSACIFFRRFRDALRAAEERVHLNAWQLRQLVPVEARAAMSIPPQAA